MPIPNPVAQGQTTNLPADIQAKLLQQLRDVHLPEAVNWWPPAIGWWLALAIVLIALLAAGRFLLRRHRQNGYRRVALSELQTHYQEWQEDKHTAQYLQAANAILKRCMLSSQPLSKLGAANQTGSQWANSLQGLSTRPLSKATQTALAEQCYQAKPKAQIESIHAELITWIKAHRAPKAPTLEAGANEAQHA